MEIVVFRLANQTKTIFFALHFGNEQIYRTKGVHANSNIFLGVRFEKSLRITGLDITQTQTVVSSTAGVN